jgi:hypothetical protein
MQFDSDFLLKWEQIVNDVEKEHIPIECVKKVVFRNNENKQKTINLKTLKKQNLNIEEVCSVVERYIQENEDTIVSIEFVIDIEAVAEILQPETDQLLKGMK